MSGSRRIPRFRPWRIRRFDLTVSLVSELPYRIDIACAPLDAFDVLVAMGALDVELAGDGLAALLPDGVTRESVSDRLRVARADVAVSAAVARDEGSVWLLSPQAVRVGGILIAPPGAATSGKTLRLADSHAFGTGHHPTTALCLEALEEILTVETVDSILDVGTGSGILALAALLMGVPQAFGLDIDLDALHSAAENARLNQLDGRLQLIAGGPDVVRGAWPLVVANVQAAPLIDMAPVLVQRLGRRGRVILSGISWTLEPEVRRAYQHFGVQRFVSKTRDGWTVLTGEAGW